MCRLACQLAALTAAAAGAASAQRLRITNACDKEPLWVAHMAGAEDGPDPQNAKLGPGEHRDFDTHDGLSSTRYWPKMRCDEQGSACLIGESGGPGQECSPTMGCAPPIDSKFEGTFGTEAGIDWIDVSLVDGWSLPFKFKMTLQGKGKCNAGDGNRTVLETLDCSTLTLDECPTNEHLNSEMTNLQVIHPDSDQVVGCYSPCAKLTSNNWNNHIADGVSTADEKAVPYCCPTPPKSPEACRSGPVEQTAFVKAVHKNCPGVYGYSYDDGMGLITCPKDTKYEMIFYCPDGSGHTEARDDGRSHGEGSDEDTLAPPASTTSSSPDQEPPDDAEAPKERRQEDTEDSDSPGFSKVEEKKYPHHEYCGDRYIFEGLTADRQDCQKKCEVEEQCGFYSYWISGNVQWCRATATCDTKSEDKVGTIEIFRKRSFTASAAAHVDAACCFEGSHSGDPCGQGCLPRSEIHGGFCVPRDIWCETCTDDASCHAPAIFDDIGHKDSNGEIVVMRKDAFQAIVDKSRRKRDAGASPTVLMALAAAVVLLVATAVKLGRATNQGPANSVFDMDCYATRSECGSPGVAGSPMPAQARSP